MPIHDYMESMGLHDNPFAADHESLWEGLLQLSQQVEYELAFNTPLVILEGGLGSGKTALADHLQIELGKRQEALYVDAASIGDVSILHLLAVQLLLPVTAKSETELMQELAQIWRAEKLGPIALILDNADRLSSGQLSELMAGLVHHQLLSSDRIELVFLGRPGTLPSKVKGLASVPFTAQLPAPDRQSLCDLLNARLVRAGATESYFTCAMVTPWLKTSEGNIAKVLELAERHLLEQSFADEKSDSSLEQSRFEFEAGAEANSAAAAKTYGNEQDNEPASNAVADAQIDRQLPPDEVDWSDTGEHEAYTQPSDEDHQAKRPLPLVHILVAAGLLSALGLYYLYVPDDQEPAQRVVIVKRTAEPALQSDEVKPSLSTEATASDVSIASRNTVVSDGESSQISRANDSDRDNADTSHVTDGAQPSIGSEQPSSLSATSNGSAKALITDDDTTSAVASSVTQRVTDESLLQSSSEAAEQLAKASASAESVRPLTRQFQFDEEELLSWPEGHYTLQVLGVSKEASVKAYVERQSNKEYMRIYKSQRSGKPWYVVVVGRYDSAQQARQAISGLPEVQRNASPWVRQVSAVQEEISR